MLYGHIEEPRHRVDHVLRLRELQDETGGFHVFIPLRYQHDASGDPRNRIQDRTTMASGAEVLKTFAVSRLLFDNVDHVKNFWVMHGLTTAQLSLSFGADDLDGSVVEYKITHDADGFGTPNTMTREDLLELIREAGFRPVERGTRYETLREYDGPDATRGTVPRNRPACRSRSPEDVPMSSERRPPKPAGIGAISMLAAVVVLVPGIVLYVLLRAVGLGIGGAGVIALFVMILGMVVYPLVLRRTGWVGPPPARRTPGAGPDEGERP